jgi:hypothetical protein
MPYKETAPFSLTFSVRPSLSLFLSCAFSPQPLQSRLHFQVTHSFPLDADSLSFPQFMSASIKLWSRSGLHRT